MEDKLYDIEYWLPFRGGEYHCTIAVGVTQEYVNKVKQEYDKSLERWKNTPSAWKLPFHHTIKVIEHSFMSANESLIKTSEYNKAIAKVKEEGIEEGMKKMANNVKFYITDQKKLTEFKKNYSKFFK